MTKPRASTRPPAPRLSRAVIAAVWLLAAAGAIAVLLIAATAAEGGTYRAAQCNPALGAERADLSFERSSDHYAARSDCEGGGGLVVRHEASRSQRDAFGAWSLEVPEGAEVVRFAAKVAGVAADGHAPSLLVAAADDLEPFARLGASPRAARWSGDGATGFEARLVCRRGDCGSGERAKVMIRRIGVRISDTGQPEASLAGPLAGGRTLRGTQMLRTLASDLGAGVRKLYLEVNGKPVGTRRIPCEVSERVATRLRPCPLDVERIWELDTAGRGFRQGLNRIRLCADDLAFQGVRNRDCARHKTRIDNDCPFNPPGEAGILRARLAGLGREGTLPHDRRARVAGTLTDPEGRPIADARVCVAEHVEGMGDRAEHVVATPRTGDDGSFETGLGKGPSREVRVAHWAGAEDVAERHLRLHVSARPNLSISPRTLRNGQTARFEVRLHGPAPGHRRVQLEVRNDGAWSIVRAHNADASGVWRDSYRFTSTSASRTYRFRAVVPRQAGYPYQRGTSRVRRVRVQG